MLKHVHASFFVVISFYLMFLGLKNIYFYNKLINETQLLERKFQEATQKNISYKKQLHRLEHYSDLWEMMARKTFQFILPGEIVYKIVYTNNKEKKE